MEAQITRSHREDAFECLWSGSLSKSCNRIPKLFDCDAGSCIFICTVVEVLVVMLNTLLDADCKWRLRRQAIDCRIPKIGIYVERKEKFMHLWLR